ncbi:arginase family protein [Nocardia arthritidis]|uniref:Arginase family protein n=1 Tax=Nocardia arthritidis TaxID=228602 RepID=A0A6G9YGM3_9NOCA|nr:arginase family protein [Nocardia arthritidis]QIS12379.1 arginase family protein [Nocardia arthritidis]
MRFLVPYHLDESRPELDAPLTADAVLTVDLPETEDRWARMAVVYESVAARVAESARRGERPVVMAGDCTTALGTVAGLQRAGLDPAVVWFDAHGDLQTLETTTSGYLGGLPLRMLVGYGRPLVADRIGLRDVPESRVVLTDARDLDPAEVDYLKTAEVRRRPVTDLGELPDGPIYLHIDFDVIDPEELPGLMVPAPGGPGLRAVTAAVGRVLDTGRVAAVGLACTWHDGVGAAERVRSVVELL